MEITESTARRAGLHRHPVGRHDVEDFAPHRAIVGVEELLQRRLDLLFELLRRDIPSAAESSGAGCSPAGIFRFEA